jgi:hypothetical protein
VLVLVAVTGGLVLGMAASATPGSPLYGLRRLEQHVQVQLAGSAAARAQLHLAYALDALDALDAAVSHHAQTGAYAAALDAFQTEVRAAAQSLTLVPPGAQHDAIAVQLAALRQHGRHDLRAALASRDWSERISTTRVLGQLGATVPTITSAQVEATPHGTAQQWRITLLGSGFEADAQLLLNEQPVGAERAITPTEFQATVELPPGRSIISVGIGNPDGTAVTIATPQITLAPDTHGHAPTPTPTNAGGPPGRGGGHNGTPGPTPPSGP